MGDSSPAVTATMASSSSPRPSSTRPCWIRAQPCSCMARASRSASPKRSPISAASAAAGVRGLPITGSLMPQHHRHQQIAPLDAVFPFALYQPLGAAEPSGRAAHLSSECKVDAHPERAAHSAHRFAGVEVRVIGTLQAIQAVVVAAEHEGRRCEQLEVLRSQRSRLIGV